MRISVVTPVLNGARYIRQTIDSVLSQRGDFELEYIVKDGGSEDGTLEIVAAYGDAIRLVTMADGSPAEAINQGMALAGGDIGGWLNADDYFHPGTLARVVASFREHPQCRWVTGKCHTVDAAGEEIRLPITLYINLMNRLYGYRRLLTENFINQSATFWRMELWHESGGLDPAWKAAFDYELWLKMGRSSGPPLWIPEYLAAGRRHDDSISERNYHDQFREELEISYRYTESRLLRFLHLLKARRTVAVYDLLGLLSRNGNQKSAG